MNFDQDILLQSIEKIDNDPTLRLSRTSSTYDLSYKGNLYPPILVLSVASQLNGGKELFLKDFNNSIEIPFKILKNNGFEIVKVKESKYWGNLKIVARKRSSINGYNLKENYILKLIKWEINKNIVNKINKFIKKFKKVGPND